MITSNTAQWMGHAELANALAETAKDLRDIRARFISNVGAKHDQALNNALREIVLDFNTLVTEQQRRNSDLLKLIGE